jgi:hypothetical protein
MKLVRQRLLPRAQSSGYARDTARLSQKMGGSAAGLRLLDFLFEQPLISVRLVEQHLQCSYVTASKLVEQFVELNQST